MQLKMNGVRRGESFGRAAAGKRWSLCARAQLHVLNLLKRNEEGRLAMGRELEDYGGLVLTVGDGVARGGQIWRAAGESGGRLCLKRVDEYGGTLGSCQTARSGSGGRICDGWGNIASGARDELEMPRASGLVWMKQKNIGEW